MARLGKTQRRWSDLDVSEFRSCIGVKPPSWLLSNPTLFNDELLLLLLIGALSCAVLRM